MGSSHAIAPEISAGQPLLLPPSYFILSMISDILASPEGKQLELKHDLSSPTPSHKTLVAFANSADRITMDFAAGDFFLPPSYLIL
jgi:hypothetical protein